MVGIHLTLGKLMPILIRSNGRRLTMHRVEGPVLVLEATKDNPTPTPLPLHDDIWSDDDARTLARNLLATQRYTRTL